MCYLLENILHDLLDIHLPIFLCWFHQLYDYCKINTILKKNIVEKSLGSWLLVVYNK